MKGLKAIALLALWSVSTTLWAGEETITNLVRGSAISTNGSVAVADQYFGETGNYLVTDQNVVVKLFHNDVLKNFISPTWSLTVDYSIDLRLTNGTATTETGTLSIDWDDDPDQTITPTDVHIYQGYAFANLTITGVTYSEGGSNLPNDFHLELALNTQRYYDLNTSSFPIIYRSDHNSTKRTLDLGWDFIPGAEEYELEWVFVADGSEAGSTHSSSADIMFDFNDATRIQLSNNHYEIPLSYPKGSLIYRVRAVGYDLSKADFKKHRVYSAWSYPHRSNRLYQIDQYHDVTSHCYYYTSGVDNDKNWTHTATYAEEGKRKDLAVYADGSGRTRQQVTILNSKDLAVVGETRYDAVGRPAVQILPVPVESEGIRFYGDNTSSFNGLFDHTSFATDPMLSNLNSEGLPLPLPSSSKARQYYSAANPLSFENKNAVPDANGYAYTFTQYTNDGLERPKVQAGLGDSLRYKAQGTRNTRYFYGTPTQIELDRLFGNEAGLAKYYQKNMVVDPNGQQSIQYLDGSGRVVATALSGAEPGNLDPLRNQSTVALATPIFNGPKPKATSDNLRQSMSFSPSEPTNMNVSYNLSGVKFVTCQQGTSTIKYDTKVVVRNERGGVVASDSLIGFSQTNSANFVSFFADLGSYGITRTINVNQAQKEGFLQAADSIADAERHNFSFCGPKYEVSSDTLCSAVDCDTACLNTFSYRVGPHQYYTDNHGVVYQADPANPGNFFDPAKPSVSFSENDPNAPWNLAIASCVVECNNFNDTTGTGHDVNEFLSDGRCNITSQMMYSDMSPSGQYVVQCDTNQFCYYLNNHGNLDPHSGTIPEIQVNLMGYSISHYNVVIEDNILCLDTFYGNNILISSLDYLNEEGQVVILDNYGQWASAHASCDTSDNPLFSDSNLAEANSRLGTSYSTWGELMANWSPAYDTVLIAYHPEYCAKEFFCNFGYTCNGTDITMAEINSFAGDLYKNNDSVSSYGAAFDYMNPLGLTKNTSSNGISADNSTYIASAGLGGHVIDPLVCPSATSGLGKTAYDSLQYYLQHFVPVITNDGVLTQNYYSLWYLLDDPDGIAGSTNTGLHPDLVKVFETFHGDGDCKPGLIGGYDDKLLFFRSIYLFLREMVIYKYFDQQYICPDNQPYTYWDRDADYDGFTDSAYGEPYQLRYPRNLTYDFYGAEPAAIRAILEPRVQPDSMVAHRPISKLDTCACTNFIDYLGTDITASNTVIAQRLADDFCMEYPNDTINTLKNCALNEDYSLMFLLPDSLKCSSRNVFLAELAESCSNQKRRLAHEFAEMRYQEAKKAYLDSLSAAYDAAAYEALDSKEKLTLNYTLGEYHYTLYYYDQAGNLVKTVPPAGVVVLGMGMASNVDAHRNDTTLFSFKRPNHQYVTNYQYNSLNQVVEQHTPDGGTTKFWYDDAGRLVASQNAKQVVPGKYSYSLYDGLGRVVETGETTAPFAPAFSDEVATDHTAFLDWLTRGSRSDVVFTLYDEGLYDINGTGTSEAAIGAAFGPQGQTYLRNRVASTFRIPNISANVAPFISNNTRAASIPAWYLGYTSAIHYSYDPHGNVETLINEFSDAVLEGKGRRFFKIEYDYDLVSGNVKQVTYQRGLKDQFIHRYTYDADNRIVNTRTSRDGIVWQEDARYYYYPHGPLSRTELGDRNVQGLDYAYTLQGWLKSVNGTSLAATGELGSFDLGSDGRANDNHNRVFAPDAFGFALDYFKNDYNTIGNNNFLANISGGGNPAATGFRGLFNGNIGRMTTALNDNQENPVDVMLNNYSYDQLNRITRFNSYSQASLTQGNTGTGATAFGYRARYNYDPNGNIDSLQRYDGGGSLIDDLSYYYDRKNPTEPMRNRLLHVDDAAGQHGNDLADQTGSVDYTNYSNNNYRYDAIGNLIYDAGESLSIVWTAAGKVKTIYKGGISDYIQFDYDPAGNRIVKWVVEGGSATVTYYVRDAQGNVMATYRRNGSNLALEELNIYGSDRIGLLKEQVPITNERQNLSSGLALAAGDLYRFTRQSGSTWLDITAASALTVEATAGPLDLTGTDITVMWGKHTSAGNVVSIPHGATVALTSGDDISLSATGSFAVRLVSGAASVQGLTGSYIREADTDAEVVLGNKHYELKNHLGNVLSTVSDRKYWKYLSQQSTASSILFQQTYGAVSYGLGNMEWQVLGDGELWNEEEILYVQTEGETYLQTYFSVPQGNTCSYRLCITVGAEELPEEGFTLEVVSQAGGVLHDFTIETPGSHCFDVDAISDYGQNFTIRMFGNEPVEYSISDFGLFMNCDWEPSGGDISFSGGQNGLYISGGAGTYLSKPVAISGDASCGIKICADVEILSGSLQLRLLHESGVVIGTAPIDSSGCFSVTFAEVEGIEYASHFQLYHQEATEYELTGLTVEQNCTTITNDYVQVANVLGAQDYYPGGSVLPGRNFQGSDKHRYGFNGMERDDEVKGDNNSYDFGARMYDPRLMRWMSVDPQFKKQPGWSPYKAFLNNPIIYVDPEGETEYMVTHVIDNVSGKTYVKIDVIDEDKVRERVVRGAASISRDPEYHYEYDDIYHHQTLTINESGTATLEQGQNTYKLSHSRHPLLSWVPKIDIDIPDISGEGGGEQAYGEAIWGLADSDPDNSKKPKAKIQGDGIDVSKLLSVRSGSKVIANGKMIDEINQMKQIIDVTMSSLDLGGAVGDIVNEVSGSKPQTFGDGDTVCCEYGNTHIKGQDGVYKSGNNGGYKVDSNYHKDEKH